jgi:hypothetical protein
MSKTDWETVRKPALMERLLKLSIPEKVDLIKRSSTYRSGSDSCNSVYMGGMATSMLIHALGGAYGRDSVDNLIGWATEDQLNKALDVCAPYIDTMESAPTKSCKCCGQIVPDKGEKFSVRVLWRKHPEDDQVPSVYEFDTQIELDAFLEGVNAADGRLKATVVEDDEDDYA